MRLRSIYTNKSGFTLVELAIVIVIIGFIVAGVAAGSSLINQAQIRSVISDFRNIQVSYNNFVGTYNAVPGDMVNAFSYWDTRCAESDGSCNGNGDGVLQTCLTDYGITESRKAYKHLALAEMINLNPPQITDSEDYRSGGLSSVIRGTTHIPSKVSGGMYFFQGSFNCNDGFSWMFSNFLTELPWKNESRVNTVYLSKSKRNSSFGDSDAEPTAGALKAEDAFVIDQKIDDGAIDAGGNFTGATTGSIRTVNGDPDNVSSQPCLDPTLTFYDVSGSSSSEEACVIGYRLN